MGRCPGGTTDLGLAAEAAELVVVVRAAGHAPDVHEGGGLDGHHGEGPVEEQRLDLLPVVVPRRRLQLIAHVLNGGQGTVRMWCEYVAGMWRGFREVLNGKKKRVP